MNALLSSLISLAVALILMGCAGPSKARYAELLHECRVSNRERVKIIKAYESSDCKTHPAADLGVLNFGEAGH